MICGNNLNKDSTLNPLRLVLIPLPTTQLILPSLLHKTVVSDVESQMCGLLLSPVCT